MEDPTTYHWSSCAAYALGTLNPLITFHPSYLLRAPQEKGKAWDDLKLVLPRAREKGIRIWASIVPPSESPPQAKMYAEPFKLDYERWGVEFAKLSVQETNLVAWSIDDYTHNLAKTYTPEYVRKMLAASRAINWAVPSPCEPTPLPP